MVCISEYVYLWPQNILYDHGFINNLPISGSSIIYLYYVMLSLNSIEITRDPKFTGHIEQIFIQNYKYIISNMNYRINNKSL